jgi:hypothetical protein
VCYCNRKQRPNQLQHVTVTSAYLTFESGVSPEDAAPPVPRGHGGQALALLPRPGEATEGLGQEDTQT